jgi:hypothetical protein
MHLIWMKLQKFRKIEVFHDEHHRSGCCSLDADMPTACMSLQQQVMVTVAWLCCLVRTAMWCRPEVERLERQLRLFSDTLDEWLECQKQWLYLETIFRQVTGA